MLLQQTPCLLCRTVRVRPSFARQVQSGRSLTTLLSIHITSRIAQRCTESARRHASSSTAGDAKTAPFLVDRAAAEAAYRRYHRSPLTLSASSAAGAMRYLPLFAYTAGARTTFRASVGRSMSVPSRDPQSGKVGTRQRTVWTALPESFDFSTSYTTADGAAQVYAGFEQHASLVDALLPADAAHFAHSPSARPPAGAQYEQFDMTPAYALQKLRSRIGAHELGVARELLRREYGALVRLHDVAVAVTLQQQEKWYLPVWCFSPSATNAAGGGLSAATATATQTLVSGLSADRIAGVRVLDPQLVGGASGVAVGLGTMLLLGAPIFGALLGAVAYLAARTVVRWLPVWRGARLEAARRAEMMGNASTNAGAASDGAFDPLDTGFFRNIFGSSSRSGATGGAGAAGGEAFDPFGRAGPFGGPRRSGDPFYRGPFEGQASRGGRQSSNGGGGFGSSPLDELFEQFRRQQEAQQQRRAGAGSRGGSYGSSSSRTSTGSGAARGPANDPLSLYKTLGVSASATKGDITTAFRKLALEKHPDKQPAEKRHAASAEFAKINEAYRVLRDEGRRARYDRHGVV